ncbi:MAG: O-antigen ligase family protein [Polyangiaceae bacterium]
MESRRTDDDTPLPEPPAELGAPSRPRRILQQEQLLWVMVAVAVAGSVMAIGSVHTVVLVPVAALAAASAIVAAPLRELGARDRAWPAPSLVFLGLALFTALQAVPLPMGVLKVIAPANADVWSRSLLPFDARPEWGSLSLDPGATVVESLKWLTYACTFFSATVLGARRGTQAVLAVVLGSATLLSVVTVAHGMVDAKKVFGLYEPSHSFLPHHIGPLLNSNNLAGYLNLGAITGAGLMLARRPILPVWVTGLCVSVDIAGTVRSGSRGGVAALILGVLLLALVLRAKSSKSRRVQRRAAPLILVTGAVVFGGALALLGGDVFVWRELFTDNAAKLKIVSWCAPLLREYGWLGVGRGAFETVFAAYRPSAGMHVVYTHPENFPAQWASEWGIPVALAALGSLAWMFRPGALGVRKSAVIAGAWVAVLALALQNLADLGFEIPAVGIATASVLGALWSDPVRKRGRERTLADRSLSRFGPRGFAMGTAVATGMLCVLWR